MEIHFSDREYYKFKNETYCYFLKKGHDINGCDECFVQRYGGDDLTMVDVPDSFTILSLDRIEKGQKNVYFAIDIKANSLETFHFEKMPGCSNKNCI